MKTIPAGQFKARCLRLMDEVRTTREPVLITKKGRPVAKLVPAEGQPEDIFGCLKDEIKIVGDIESPVVPLEDWDALR
jgi:prevent-host-death family protein